LIKSPAEAAALAEGPTTTLIESTVTKITEIAKTFRKVCIMFLHARLKNERLDSLNSVK